jgi:hypothetical protein
MHRYVQQTENASIYRVCMPFCFDYVLYNCTLANRFLRAKQIWRKAYPQRWQHDVGDSAQRRSLPRFGRIDGSSGTRGTSYLWVCTVPILLVVGLRLGLESVLKRMTCEGSKASVCLHHPFSKVVEKQLDLDLQTGSNTTGTFFSMANTILGSGFLGPKTKVPRFLLLFCCHQIVIWVYCCCFAVKREKAGST